MLKTNNLLAYYPFEGNANDGSGKGNNGTLTKSASGTYSTYDTGRLSKSLNSAGTQNSTTGGWVQIPASSTISPSTQFTICAWIWMTGQPGGPDGGTIVVKRKDAENSGASTPFNVYDMYISYTSPYKVTLMTSTGAGSTVTTTFTTSIPLTTWTHIACVFNKPNINCYVNGIKDVTTGTNNITLGSNASFPYPINIGAFNTASYMDAFVGGIDEVLIYGVALSQNDIKRVMLGLPPING
jgi:hypothetical protein